MCSDKDPDQGAAGPIGIDLGLARPPVLMTGTDLTKPTYKTPRGNITFLHQKSKGRRCGAVDASKAMKDDMEVP